MANPRVALVSLGCVKNLVESEVLLGRLADGGFDLCSDPGMADVALINTCGFLADSEKESLEAIDAATALKGKGRLRAVVVAGCLPQRYGPGFEKRLRGVDAVLGISARDDILRVCSTLLEKRRTGAPLTIVPPPDSRCATDRDRVRLTPRHTAYVRVSEGCDHACAFCVIPRIRGKFRSKPMEEIVSEARELAADGAREINLIAQDTSTYGADLFGKPSLDELLKRLEDIPGLEWVRILYSYPTSVTDRLILEIARNSKVVKYLDLPVQHTREKLLRAMRRGIAEDRQKDLIRKLRDGVPGLVLRTTVLVGFPGETDEDFEGLLEDLRELRFERLGAFAYSREAGSRSDALEGHLPEDVRLKRRERVMIQQQAIAFSLNREMLGREVPVLIDRPLGKGRWEGRTAGDAPEIDPVITLSGNSVREGELARARVTGWSGYDLIGTIGAARGGKP
jgi:ribosomal protein S12 methylthiotransferase